jgi:hypothetical protein
MEVHILYCALTSLIAEITNASHNFRRYYWKKLFSFIIGKILQSSLRSTTLGNFRLKTFKGRNLKIVQALEQDKTWIFRDIKFLLSEHVSDKGIGGNY